MDVGFEIVEEAGGDVPVVCVRGELDLVTAAQLQDRLLAIFDAGSPSGILDLTDVTFIDSSGLSVLVTTQKRCQDNGGQLQLVITSKTVLRVFEITGLTQHFNIVERRS